QAMRAAAGCGFIVIFRNEFRDGLGEFVAERRAVRRRPEANLGIHRQGCQAFARLARTTNEVAQLADDPCAQGDEIARGQPAGFLALRTLRETRGETLSAGEVRFTSCPGLAIIRLMRRDNHYEAAFEWYLRDRGIAVVPIDEARRSYLDADEIKSPDFIVVGP